MLGFYPFFRGSYVYRFAVHSACLNLTNIENIETMAEDHPEWLLTVNNAGYNPVQLLCRKGLINEYVAWMLLASIILT